ncbi:thioredoxin H-type [Brachionus plicatilis]|uniref:Thioredoxin H-type n=1 Tax=Brachionus plicatilis TaxID=10195 RepID=A0A3M7R1G3_BRAPC|nr:thioredoxin H-type [Brachionus plicatilis]
MTQKPKGIPKVSDLGEFEEITSKGLAVVIISASWCGVCRYFEPTTAKLAKEYSNIKFLKIDLDEAEEAMPDAVEHVCTVPHFDFYHNGEIVGEYSGSKADQLKNAIEKFRLQSKDDNQT